ncbi:MAG: ADP-glyceromanno-heptose 6-epimerase [Parachlamydiaceae bacterium]|nr:ADP-glyceromanno-heptose 6-epimerase [Parachlamydiaceae bacterium]
MQLYDDQLIVITGGAGFIGSCFVRYLNDLGINNILIVDEFRQNEKWKNLVGKKFFDIIPKQELFQWLEGKDSEVEAFIHLGACSDTMEKDEKYLYENNYKYSVRLAEYALEYDKRFIYASSAATYGNGLNGFSDDHEGLFLLKPLNMYGFSKQLFDQWAYSHGVLDRLTGLKFFNVFGPNENHKGRMISVPPKMVDQILNGHPVRLFKSSDREQFADGEQKRDFIYVKDVVSIIYQFLKNDVCGIFNVGSGIPSTWNQLAYAVFNALDKKPNIEYIDMPPELIKQYQNFSCADMTKTKKALGKGIKQTSLDESILDYVRNYILLDEKW